MDVDAGTETVEPIIDPSAQVAGKRMRYMILNEDISRSTSNLYAALPVGMSSQELASVMDSTWDAYFSPEKKASK